MANLDEEKKVKKPEDTPPVVNERTDPSDSSNVATVSTEVAGTIFVAPLGTEYPEDAHTELGEEFSNVGYVSEDGIEESTETDSEDHKEMGGGVVLTSITSNKKTYKFSLIENRESVFDYVFGKENVSVTEANGTKLTKIDDKVVDYPQCVVVIQMLLTGGKKYRKVLPVSKITELGNTKYSSSDILSYDITITCSPDITGARGHYFIEEPTTA